MDDSQSLETRLALSIIAQMVRDGVLGRDVILRAADRAEQDGEMAVADAAHGLLLETRVQSASEFEADYRRRQMVERTARIGRDPNA